MNVFISWSQGRSKALAQALYDWLPTIIQDIEPWMSEHNIEKGTRGIPAITKELGQTHFGIICLTPESLNAPWLLFEAGALSKSGDQARVWTLLFELEHTNVEGPLAQFQHTKADKEDVRKLLRAINIAQGSPLITDQQLTKSFERGWEEFEQQLRNIPPIEGQRTPQRSQQDMVKEILELVRGLSNSQRRVISALSARKVEETIKTPPLLPPRRRVQPPNEQTSEIPLLSRPVSPELKNKHLNLQVGDKVFSNIYGTGSVVEKGERVFAVRFDSAQFSSFSYGDAGIYKFSESAEPTKNSKE